MKFKEVNSDTISSNKNKVVIPNMNIVFRAILIIFCSVLISNIIRNIFGGGTVTFTSFLQYITSVPQVDSSLNMSLIHISGDWALLDDLRVFLNTIMQPLNILVFLAKNLWNCLMYIVYFLRFLMV